MLMVAVAAGNGVVLNLPWVAIWFSQYWLIYPTPVSTQTQQNWRWCSRCNGLYWAGSSTTGVCPGGGAHGPKTGSNYKLVMDVSNYQGKHDWRGGDHRIRLFW